MNVKSGYVVLMLMLMCVVLLAGCSTKLTARDVAKMVADRIESIKTMKVYVYINNNYTEYFVMKKPDKSYNKYANGKIVIMNGSKEWEYLPKEDVWICYNITPEVFNSMAVYTNILRMLNNKSITLLGEKNGCYILEVKQKNETTKIWVNKKLEFPVKLVVYKNGKAVGEMLFKDVEINVPVRDSLFYPKGKVVSWNKWRKSFTELYISTAKTGELSLEDLKKEFGIRLFVPNIKGLKYDGGFFNANVQYVGRRFTFINFNLVMYYKFDGGNISFNECFPMLLSNNSSENYNETVYNGVKVYYSTNVSGVNETFFYANSNLNVSVANGIYLVDLTSNLPVNELLKIIESTMSNNLNSSLRVRASIFYYTKKKIKVDNLQKYVEKYLNFKPLLFNSGILEDAFIDSCSDNLTLDYWYNNASITVIESKNITIPSAIKIGKFYVYSVKEGNTSAPCVAFKRNGLVVEAYTGCSCKNKVELLTKFLNTSL